MIWAARSRCTHRRGGMATCRSPWPEPFGGEWRLLRQSRASTEPPTYRSASAERPTLEPCGSIGRWPATCSDGVDWTQ